jgi:hypothetical protein
MNRRPSFCDFCGVPEVSKAYSTDEAGIHWYACPGCVELIENEDWDRLVDRCLAAYGQTRFLLDHEKTVILGQVEARVRAFRSCRLVPA